jgi:hypothetical protein
MSALIDIHSHEAVRDILKSDQFSAYPMIEVYEQIQAKTGLDFNASLRLLRCLPLFLVARQHQEVRKIMAVKLATVQATQRNAVRKEIERLAGVLTPGVDIDLICEFALPLWRSTSQCILPREGELSHLIESITKLFYPTLSLRKRLQINDGIQKYIDSYGDDAHEQLIMLSMAALGARPFVGSFALSIYDIVANNNGKLLSQIDWPTSLVSSSLRFVDRMVVNQTTSHGIDFNSGDRVRCYTHESIYSDRSNVEALFGYGPHVCLGRTITEYCWRLLVDRFSKLDVSLEPLECRMDSHTEPFTMPVIARVRVA